MKSNPTPIQTAHATKFKSAPPQKSNEKSNNLPAVQDGAQCAQLKTRLDVFENRLTDVEGTVIAIQGTVIAIQGTVIAIQGTVTAIRDDV
ncbi:hypothetical protein E4U46_000293 [Claviceps purpurea]|nr:hypothetical protein E4U46_000293 [Claviceps purpurea]